MASIEEFLSRYQALYGKFPIYGKTEIDRQTMALWRNFVSPLTPDKMERVFAILNAQRAKFGERQKPLLESFQRASNAADLEYSGSDIFKSKEEMEAEKIMGTPLFDFETEGFPQIREAYLIELPKKTVRRWGEIWGNLMSLEITAKEFKEIMKREKWYLPEWEDYQPNEKARLLAKWKTKDPEAIPF